MARSIRRLGLVGATLAFLLIAGLNFTALNRQWDVPYIGVQEANAWAKCVEGVCVIVKNGTVYSLKSCWNVSVWVLDPCAQSCSMKCTT